MKAIILAGGFAKRLWPLTQDFPKALLDVGGRPLLTYTVEKLGKIADIEEIVVSTNAGFEQHFREWMATLKCPKPLQLVVEPALSEGEKFGAMKGLWYAVNQAGINGDLMVINGDNLFDFELADFLTFYEEKTTPVVAFFDVKDMERAKLYGIAKVDGNSRVTEFVEKSPNPPSTLASTGCYIFPAEAVGMIGNYLESGNPKDAPGFFMAWLVKQMPIHGFAFSGSWFDIGDPKSLKEAEEWMNRKR